MKEIQLTQEKVALVDDEDFELVSRYKWFASEVGGNGAREKRWYAFTGKSTRMHRLILNPSFSEHVDHKNGDGLDNRRSNIRIATPSQNNANSRKREGCSSEHKGVCWDINKCKWLVTCNGKYVGRFDSETTAALAYNEKALEVFGEFAKLNDVNVT